MNAMPQNARQRGMALRGSAVATSIALCLMALPAVSKTPPRFGMTAVVDMPGGEQIVRGDYAEAIDILANSETAAHASAALFRYTNLCVAHTITERSAAAVRFCDEAVESAQSRSRFGETMSERKANLGQAHANRAVALWLAGSRAAAEIDLAAAVSYAPRDGVVKANAAAFAARREPVASVQRD